MLWEIDETWTLFLDRDGVVNVRLMDDYVKTTSEFELLPGVAEAISKAKEKSSK
jgi:histidinol phosphatase-like enzyme